MTNPQEIKETVQPESEDVATHGEGSDHRARVLLVEDDNALRRYLEVTLQRAGYAVISAADGLQGMKLALTTQVDIVITDAMMPNLSGHEFCRFLRNSNQLSHIPIVLLSAREQRESNREEEYADAFLSKPVSAQNLTDCLEGLLTGEEV